MIRRKWVPNERVLRPIVSKGYISPVDIKNVKELKEELKDKIYTNIYTFNTLCDGIYVRRGIYAITGRRNSGKSSLCAHICVNLFFNDVLHYFHLFYSAFFDFVQFLEKKNVENKFCLRTANRLRQVGTEFAMGNKNFGEFKQLVRYLFAQFVQSHGGEGYGGYSNGGGDSGRDDQEERESEPGEYGKKEKRSHGLLRRHSPLRPHRFSKRRAIYVDLDNSFYIDRYKNMIRASLEKIKKLMETYKEFCCERKCSLFLLLLEGDRQLKDFLSPLRKKYDLSYDPLIQIFNHHLDKYLNRITFSDVYKSFQLLKVFNFGELINVVNFINSELQKCQQPWSKHFSRYVPSDLGVLVVDNLNYVHRGVPQGKNKWENELKQLLKTLSKLSTENKVCVLVTNNDNKYFKKKEERFFHLYSKYVYSHVLVKFINEKKLFEFYFPSKGKSKARRGHGKGNQDESGNRNGNVHVNGSMIRNHNTNRNSNRNSGSDGNENSSSSEQSFNDLSGSADAAGDGKAVDDSDPAEEGDPAGDNDPGDHADQSDDDEDANGAFFKKRYNLRYIKIKRKKRKPKLCFFEINEFGIETMLG
ncbi:hypothetical protein C922_04458 [Plasmodium inui San Antonio 1]|uniref:Uncharacterized protein n=1 Tax=Plasmodium inui San Antonio 1 TaxID=1237626 RepID=W6ZWK0_9APIC|nr:hypothetical protein C922_04458 [Plasmodium inui San Antonio 1]EUD65172.1 hypothetical protein C922_04458 [Plasmodium inui San Antonio 1]